MKSDIFAWKKARIENNIAQNISVQRNQEPIEPRVEITEYVSQMVPTNWDIQTWKPDNL